MSNIKPWTAAGIAAMATAAHAGSVYTYAPMPTATPAGGVDTSIFVGDDPSNNTASVQFNHYQDVFGPGALPVQQSGVTDVAGATMSFGSITDGTVGSDNGLFYLGSAGGLNDAQPDVWFNTVPGGFAGVGADTTVLGFANNPASGFNFSDMEVTISFAPGVQGFVFNYADIGDVSEAELIVNWNDGSGDTVALTTVNDPTGVVSILAGDNREIQSIRLTQNLDRNDGFLFYGFNTLVVVPLPPAAWATLGLLAPLGVMRQVRRRRR